MGLTIEGNSSVPMFNMAKVGFGLVIQSLSSERKWNTEF